MPVGRLVGGRGAGAPRRLLRRRCPAGRGEVGRLGAVVQRDGAVAGGEPRRARVPERRARVPGADAGGAPGGADRAARRDHLDGGAAGRREAPRRAALGLRDAAGGVALGRGAGRDRAGGADRARRRRRRRPVRGELARPDALGARARCSAWSRPGWPRASWPGERARRRGPLRSRDVVPVFSPRAARAGAGRRGARSRGSCTCRWRSASGRWAW